MTQSGTEFSTSRVANAIAELERTSPEDLRDAFELLPAAERQRLRRALMRRSTSMTTSLDLTTSEAVQELTQSLASAVRDSFTNPGNHPELNGSPANLVDVGVGIVLGLDRMVSAFERIASALETLLEDRRP